MFSRFAAGAIRNAGLLGVVASVVVGACGSPPRRPAPEPPAPKGVLGAGDVFEVRVYGEPELSGAYRVSPDGSIDFPLIGSVVVADTTDAVLNQRLTQMLRRFVKDPQVSIYVREYNSQKVFVFGQVNKPGTFPYEQGMSVVQAITLAGGFAKLADKSGTYVTRATEGGEEHIRVSVPAIGEGREPNLELKPGDIIYVPEAIF